MLMLVGSLAGLGVGSAPAGGGIAASDPIANVPVDLPGHDYGPRKRPRAETPEEPAPPQVAAPADPPLGGDAAPPADVDEGTDAAAPKREWFGSLPVWEWSRLTGDWHGARTGLENAGLTISGSYTLDWSSVWAGGRRNVASTTRLLDVNALLDLNQAVGWGGGSAFIDFYSSDSGGGPGDVGDYQFYSNLYTGDDDDRSVDQIAELWFEQVLFGGLLRAKAGKIEANSEFAFIESAGEFIHASAGFSPTIPFLPSFPETATGAVVQLTPLERGYISGGFFDGAMGVDDINTGRNGPRTFFSNRTSDDDFWIIEAGIGWTLGAGREGRFAGGVWRHTGLFEQFQPDPGVDENGDPLEPGDPVTDEGTTGFYFLADQRVWARNPDDAESDRGLSLLGQFGWADEDVVEASLHIAGGIVLLGTIGDREDDATGIYVSHVELSRDAGFAEDETAIELFYRVQVTPAVSIKPGLHVIFNPGGDVALDTAVVGTVRIEVAF